MVTLPENSRPSGSGLYNRPVHLKLLHLQYPKQPVFLFQSITPSRIVVIIYFSLITCPIQFSFLFRIASVFCFPLLRSESSHYSLHISLCLHTNISKTSVTPILSLPHFVYVSHPNHRTATYRISPISVSIPGP